MLDPKLSRVRQQRLLKEMQQRKLDAVVVGLSHHVYYFSATLPHWLHQGAFVLFADGRSWLTTGNKPAENAAADEPVSFEASWMATLRQEQPAVVATQVIELLKSRRAREVGIDSSAVTAQVALMAEENDVEPIDPVLWQLRRCKDADELALMRKACDCSAAMYRKAKEMIEPGVAETDVFAELEAAAVREAQEPLSAPLGNDYACGAGGGPPRAGRKAEAGELYVLDVGPAYRGYFSDCCRTFSVDRKPTDAQKTAWNAVVAALQTVERMAKPGVRCREIFNAVDEHLRECAVGKFPHHLGHGVGLQPHEYPHLNPRWDDVLMEGEVFTAEPGLYAPELKGGIRLENDYVVTKNGVQSLIDFPLQMI